jgi:hypothetical protein
MATSTSRISSCLKAHANFLAHGSEDSGELCYISRGKKGGRENAFKESKISRQTEHQESRKGCQAQTNHSSFAEKDAESFR